MSSSHPGLAAWHAHMRGEGELAALIGEDAVFHSPVVHTPQVGKAKVLAYLSAASVVLGNDSFRYVRELVDGDDVLLEFTAEIDGIHVNGIDLICFDSAGQIADFKVMVRPMKAMNKLWEMMAAQLQASS
jgi:SnoaL-like domain